jgi:hypothetical protein
MYSSRGGSFEQGVDPMFKRITRKRGRYAVRAGISPVRAAQKNVWQVLSQRPSRLALEWRYGKKR